MARTRVMVWGAGFFAKKWLETVSSRPDCEVIGVASRSPERAGTMLGELGMPSVPVFADWQATAATGAADAVIVTLPQALHPEAVVRALDAGWHVLVEKPLSVDPEGAALVRRTAALHRSQVVMVNQNFRWRPHTQALARALRDGMVGRVGHVSFDCRQSIRRQTIGAWREQMPEPYLLDFAIHHLDLTRFLLADEPRAVSGRGFRPDWSWFSGNSAASATIEMCGGSVVHYGGTMVSSGFETPPEGVITVQGERGSLRLDEASQVRCSIEGSTTTLPQAAVKGGELGYALAEFLSSVQQGRQPEVDVEEHCRSLAMAFGIIESGRTGKRVTL